MPKEYLQYREKNKEKGSGDGKQEGDWKCVFVCVLLREREMNNSIDHPSTILLSWGLNRNWRNCNAISAGDSALLSRKKECKKTDRQTEWNTDKHNLKKEEREREIKKKERKNRM